MTDTTEFMVEAHTDFEHDDFVIAKRCADTLQKHYPGHLWAVSVNSEKTGGVVNIYNLAISSRYGYVLHLTTVLHDPKLTCVMRAGGEILERAKMMRGKAHGEVAEHIDGVPDKHQPIRGIIQ